MANIMATAILDFSSIVAEAVIFSNDDDNDGFGQMMAEKYDFLNVDGKCDRQYNSE